MYEETGAATVSPSTKDESSMLTRVRHGDEGAMASLFDHHSKTVYSVALRVLRDPGAAEDVLHEVFMEVWRHPESFLPVWATLGDWLAVIARNRSVDALRRKRPTESLAEIAWNGEQDEEMPARTRRAIMHLPVEQRKLLEMAFFDGLTHIEIAEITGESLSTVKSRMRGALASLRKATAA